MHINLKLFLLIFLTSSFFCYGQAIDGRITFEKRSREYIIFLPKDYGELNQLPLIINLHGNYPGFNGSWQMKYTGMNMVADTANFIVVYPTGINTQGEPGFWSTGNFDSLNTISFFNALLDTLESRYKVNTNQIYICGHSAGGFMSHKLIAELNHRIAAAASEGGGINLDFAQTVNLKRATPILIIHGTEDPLVPFTSAERTFKFWSDQNNSTAIDTIYTPDIDKNDGSSIIKIIAQNDLTRSLIIFFKVMNGGHTWPGATFNITDIGNTNRDINASSEIWNFFKNYRLSELNK